MSIDRYLREWGFIIHARPLVGQPVWQDRVSKRTYTEAEAYEIAWKREKAAGTRQKVKG